MQAGQEIRSLEVFKRQQRSIYLLWANLGSARSGAGLWKPQNQAKERRIGPMTHIRNRPLFSLTCFEFACAKTNVEMLKNL
jgi:hypothetical protein